MDELVKIILIDDDEVDREAIMRALKEAKIPNPVIMANDGVEALELLRGEAGSSPIPQPYLILLDLNMPRMGGVRFLRELRADPRTRGSVVLVLTTSNSDHDRFEVYDLNVAGFITKANAAKDFSLLAKFLDIYWQIVEFPPSDVVLDDTFATSRLS
ncbi:MAG: response regulator [Burkholderiaceae bacterium]